LLGDLVCFVVDILVDKSVAVDIRTNIPIAV